jgi:CHAT domain-containing protein
MRTYDITLSKKLVESFTSKYQHESLFIRINGSYYDHYYASLRAVQKSIAKQIVEQHGFTYKSRMVSINMEFIYDDENITITMSDWIPSIQIRLKANNNERTERIYTQDFNVSQKFCVQSY